MTSFVNNSGIPSEVKQELHNLSSKYEMGLHTQQGANGWIVKAKNRLLGSDVIIKFYYWGGEDAFHAEPQSLLAFSSPHVLKVYDAGFAGSEWAYFVTPFCEEGDLDQFMKSTHISGVTAIDMCSNILAGLVELHAKRLIHRDLKPANIYLHGGAAIVGDFGSLTSLPNGSDSVVASKHAILYTPPESVSSQVYGVSGDIYQCGLVLYQLLGGHLPYDEVEWLNSSQKKRFLSLTYPDNTIFADECLRERIAKGRLLDFFTINPWIPDALVSIVRRACSLKPSSRYGSSAEFIGKLSQVRSKTRDWRIIDDVLTLVGNTSFQILSSGDLYSVQKRKGAAAWRNDNRFSPSEDLRGLIRCIEAKL